MKKAIIVSLLSVSIFGVSAQSSFASTLDSTSLVASNNESGEMEIRPYVNWNGTAYVTTEKYSNVTSSNNFFSDSPLVTNNASNPGTLRVRIVNSKGEVVGKTKDVAAGKSVRMDSIPWNSGTYTLQAKALNKTGTYTIKID